MSLNIQEVHNLLLCVLGIRAGLCTFIYTPCEMSSSFSGFFHEFYICVYELWVIRKLSSSWNTKWIRRDIRNYSKVSQMNYASLVYNMYSIYIYTQLVKLILVFRLISKHTHLKTWFKLTQTVTDEEHVFNWQTSFMRTILDVI